MERGLQGAHRVRVAFATSDAEHVNEQFRRASHLAVYDVTPSGSRLEQVHAFTREGGHRSGDRMRAIAGAAIVFVVAIGPSSAARLGMHGIRAATAPAGTRIAALLEELSQQLAARPPAAGTPGAAPTRTSS